MYVWRSFAVCGTVDVPMEDITVSETFKLVDELRCVSCGAHEYREARGKSSRVLNAMCGECYAKKENEQKGKPQELSPRKPSAG